VLSPLCRETLERAAFSVAPTAVNGYGGVVSARGQIEFRGRWTIGQGSPGFGTVESKKTTSDPGEANILAQSAIESTVRGDLVAAREGRWRSLMTAFVW